MVELNLTSGYYTGDDPSLLWEMTICQSLGDGRGAYARSLENPAPYGRLLAEFLQRETGLEPSCGRIIEIGGGYGTLMRGLLELLEPEQVTMLDISPLLLEKQRQALADSSPAIEFVREDLFSWLPRTRPRAELLIVNEIIGDLPTITGLKRRDLDPAPAPLCEPLPLPAELDEAGLRAEAARLIATYRLDIRDLPEGFNLNYGALRLIEMLAECEIRRTFISEHGSDTMLPWPFSLYSAIEPPGTHINPRRIQLKDHDEYNIRFDHLEQVARALGFTVKRFHLLEMLGLRFDDEIDYLLRRQQPASEEQEIFLEFYEHISEYQGLVLLAPEN
jgi:hypothetical protein